MKFKIGDKVIPISKSCGCDITSSNILKEAKNINQNFLYIAEIKDIKYKIYVCNFYIKNNNNTGDFFLESDLKPYFDIKTKINFVKELIK